MYLVKTPEIIKPLARNLLWNIPDSANELFLTFDDGPTPEITEQILDILADYSARATFFCVGKNASAHPEIVTRIKSEGHHLGHHSYNHLDGWKTSAYRYAHDVLLGSKVIESSLFRPPYGHLTMTQYQLLKKRFRLIMWDVLSGDFDPGVSALTCHQNVMKHTVAGSIVVFHDSLKASGRTLVALPLILRDFKARGYSFSPIPYV
jgi:peptidoglycan-N-acetylglucosamine deacetylase